MLLLVGSVFLSCVVHAQAWSFIVTGDSQSQDTWHRAILQAIKTTTPNYRFILNAGDLVQDGRIELQWKTWQTAYQEVLGDLGQEQVPPRVMAAPGNHDAVTDPGGLSNWKAFLPGQQRYGQDGRYFTFDCENARFVVLDNNQPMDAEQYALLRHALTVAPKTWTFVVQHQPIFSTALNYYRKDMDKKWGTLLFQQGADILFTGHDHIYTRSNKLRLSGDRHPQVDLEHGVVQIVTGNGGALLTSLSLLPEDEYMQAYPPAKTKSFHGYTEVTIKGNSATLRHIRTDNVVMDTATYTPNPKPQDLNKP